jgi:pimeloyl-ACP methyl ester carboxylesterase
MTIKSVQLAQGEVYYLEGGEGKNLLFLHGAIATSEAYIPLLDLLARSFHVIAPIHPGHGRSFAIPHEWKLRDYVIFYQDFFADIGFVPEILIGHSFGGTISLLLAAIGIGRKAIIMDAPGLPFTFDTSIYVRALMQEGRDVLKDRSDLQRVAQTIHAAGTLIETIVRHPEDITIFTILGPKYNIAAQVKKITIPVSILWGEKDQIVPVDLGHRFQMLIPNAKLTVYPSLGHNYSVTDGEFTYKELKKILEPS